MSKPKILIQFDPDAHASVFDSVVAVDSGVDQLLLQPNVSERDVQGLVHGAMFTRGPEDLRSTALFFGGSNVERTEALVREAKKCFFGPMRVSLMSDPNGCNTTAAAAVLCAQQSIDLADKTITVLGVGPVGQRIVHLVTGPATEGLVRPRIRICSRTKEKAVKLCDELRESIPSEAELIPFQTGSAEETIAAIDGADVVFGAAAAGVELLVDGWMEGERPPAVAVDLNAVPPAGLHGVEVMDRGEKRKSTVCYGAIGVGGFKMKIHRRCIQMLFESNDQILEVEQVYAVGRKLMTD